MGHLMLPLSASSASNPMALSFPNKRMTKTIIF